MNTTPDPNRIPDDLLAILATAQAQAEFNSSARSTTIHTKSGTSYPGYVESADDEFVRIRVTPSPLSPGIIVGIRTSEIEAVRLHRTPAQENTQ